MSFRKAAHVFTGFLSGFFLYLYIYFSVVLLVLFLLYEYSEFLRVYDTLFPELREFIVGFVLGFFLFLFSSLFLNL